MTTDRQQAAKEARRRAAAIKAAKRLGAAVEAMNDFLAACGDCQDAASPERNGAADSRIRLVGAMSEYEHYLLSVFDKEAA